MTRISKQPVHIRATRMLSYFGAELELQQPYWVPWSAILIQVTHEIAWSEILVCLNASLVGLCVAPRQCFQEIAAAQDENPLQLHIVASTLSLPWHCVGYGLIRSIDPVARGFHILTPVDPSLLANVNLLVKSNLEWSLKRSEFPNAPYVASSLAGRGSGTMKKGKAPARRRLDSA
jgi:hypothetical protein